MYRKAKNLLRTALLIALFLPAWPDAQAQEKRHIVVVRPGGIEHSEGPVQVITRELTVGTGGFLGVSLQDVKAEDRERLGLKKEEGAIVEEVEKGSPAADAGLQKNDVIINYAGNSVFSAAQLKRLVSETPVGRTVEVAVWRAGKQVVVQAKVGRRTERDPEIQIGEGPNISNWPRIERYLRSGPPAGILNWESRARLGVSVVEMTDQLAEKLGYKGKDGVLVMSVTAGSVAEKAGLKAGDLLYEIDGRSIRNSEDVRVAVERASSGQVVEAKVFRDRQTVSLKLPFEGVSKSGPQSRIIL